MRVLDAMSRGVVTCRVTDSVREIAAIMLSNDVAAVVVTDERYDACGLITKTDIVRYYDEQLDDISAEDIMTLKLVTVAAGSSVVEAVRTMRDKRIHQLIVVTEGGLLRRPVGILTSGDIVTLMVGKRDARQASTQSRCSQCMQGLVRLGQQLEIS
jgi:CBS domain-containing protein